MSDPETITSKIEDRYRVSLDDKLFSLARKPGATLQSVICGACGAFPTIVLKRLRELGLADRLPFESEMGEEPNKSAIVPELHLLDFEWYFTKKTSERIADLLINRTKNHLCLSAPTVASAICGRLSRTVLVDRNSLIKYRFRDNKDFLTFIVSDINDPLPISNSFDAIFFDPPWYPEFFAHWLWQASKFIQIGGLIAFPLFQSLMRPTAQFERLEILKEASRLGKIRIEKEIITYETPIFEQESMVESGIAIRANWRHADLVLIEINEKPEKTAYSERIINDDIWDTFLIGQQVIKLRKNRECEGGFVFGPVDGCPNYLLPSVSRTDPRRAQIDIWTSRNRVARVGKWELVSNILRHLACGHSFEELGTYPLITAMDSKSRQKLIADLRMILCSQVVI